jgi:hypothetical protein
MKKYTYAVVTATLFPSLVFATTSTLKDLIGLIASYFDDALALIMGVAVVMFVYYVVQYFMRPTDKRAEGAQYVMWSLVGFFVIFSFWGLVNVMINTFSFGQNSPGTWGNFTSIFPSGGGSGNSGSNIFNQGVPSYGSSPSQNYSSGYTSGGSLGSNYNPFGSGLSSGNRNSGSSNSGTHTSSKGATSATNSGSGAAKGACSKYFNICVSNSSGAKGMILKDSDQDFDLLDQKDGIMIGLIYSNGLSFNGTGEPFTSVPLLGRGTNAYKSSANGTTEIITGTQVNGNTLIVMLVSKNDIAAPLASKIIGSINLNK